MTSKKHQIVWREDVFPPACRSTDRIYNFLRQVGGVNPYGENNYLLAIASKVMFYQGGEFHDWPEGVEGLDQGGIEFSPETVKVPVTTKVPGTGGMETGFIVEQPREMLVKNHPLRIVKEMRWVERWPQLDGWVMLHWEAGAGGCSRAWWEQWLVPGTNLQAMGPWPERGMYWTFCEGLDLRTREITYATFSKAPAFDWMERAIQQFEFNRNKADKIADADFRMMAALSEWRDRKRKQAEAERERTRDMIADKMRPYWGTSLESGRAREHLAKRIRERGGESLGHVGN